MGLTVRERKAQQQLRRAVIIIANDLSATGGLTAHARARLQAVLGDEADNPADEEKGGKR